MHLHGFSLEILVNGQPLPEHNFPISESNLKSTNISYVMDPLTQIKKYSDFTTYVPVITPEERYTVRFEAEQANLSDIIVSRVYIDGQSDQVQHLHQSCSRVKSFFCNSERTKVYFFKFSNTFDKQEDTISDDFKVPFPVNNKPTNQNIYEKPGSITVCFFKGIIVNQNALQNNVEFEVKQVKIPKTTDNKNEEIGYTTGFDVMHAKIQPATVTKIVNLNPIAVLHLYYRSIDWFTNKEISLPILNSNQKEGDVIKSNTSEDEKKNDKIIKESQIKNNDNVKQKLEGNENINNLKRNYDEINTNEKECILKKLCVE